MDFEKPEQHPDASRPDAPLSGASIAIVAITRSGADLALQLQARLPESVCYVPVRHRFALAMGAVGFEHLGALFSEIWRSHSALVCIMATGIVVRQIAPLLRHKSVDPGVVVLDERGRFAISLVSGHVGGANHLAAKVARITGGRAVITTASDVRKKPAIDLIARETGLEIGNPGMLSRFTRAVLEDEPIWAYDPWSCLGNRLEALPNMVRLEGDVFGPEEATNIAGTGVWVSEYLPSPHLHCLALHPRNLVVGIGCNRRAPAHEILGLIASIFERERLSPLSIRNLASIDLKADEAGLLEAAQSMQRPVCFFSREDIENVTVPNPSHIVASHIGVQSVCEATALLSARSTSLMIPKQKTANVTLAVARAAFPL